MPSSQRLTFTCAWALALTALPLAVLALASPAHAGDAGAREATDAGGSPLADAGALDARAAKRDSGPISSIPPDPPPMRERGQWIFDLRYERGDVFLIGVHRIQLPAPQDTPRAMGRFALELFEGPALIERVRFDFPLLGAGELHDAGYGAPPSFEKKLTTRIGVMFPATFKGTRLELWDRATNKRFPLPWPPQETRAAAVDHVDGGVVRPPAVGEAGGP